MDNKTSSTLLKELMSDKFIIWIVRGLCLAIFIAFIISYTRFEIAASYGEHVKYFWVERNIPKSDTPHHNRDSIYSAKNQNNAPNYGIQHVGDSK